MTHKHYNWMTPEEAARELEVGEYCWYFLDWLIEPIRFVDATAEFVEFGWIGLEETEFLHREIPDKCICRAIVPEVPSE